MNDEEEIRGLYTAWQGASRARDIRRLLEFVTDDAVFMAPGQPPIRGRAAVEALFSLVTSRFEWEQDFRVEEVRVMGDWAVCWGEDSSVMTPLGGGDAQRARGWALSVLSRGPDGKWRFARGINNMTREAPAEIEKVGGAGRESGGTCHRGGPRVGTPCPELPNPGDER